MIPVHCEPYSQAGQKVKGSTCKGNHGKSAVLELSLLQTKLSSLVLAINQVQGVKVATCMPTHRWQACNVNEHIGWKCLLDRGLGPKCSLLDQIALRHSSLQLPFKGLDIAEQACSQLVLQGP